MKSAGRMEGGSGERGLRSVGIKPKIQFRTAKAKKALLLSRLLPLKAHNEAAT